MKYVQCKNFKIRNYQTIKVQDGPETSLTGSEMIYLKISIRTSFHFWSTCKYNMYSPIKCCSKDVIEVVVQILGVVLVTDLSRSRILSWCQWSSKLFLFSSRVLFVVFVPSPNFFFQNRTKRIKNGSIQLKYHFLKHICSWILQGKLIAAIFSSNII